MPISTLSLAVVGVDFPNKRVKDPARRFEIALCRAGDLIILEPEPNNPADPLAVKVLSERRVQLGYVRAERAPLIGARIRAGDDVRAIFQEQTKWGAVIRVTLDGSDPVLPEIVDEQPPQGIADDSGFYPDPEWPDD